MKTLIEIHALQNFAPSNLNRDDTGAPKDAIFGGTRRARISSQCLKRSIRLHFKDLVTRGILSDKDIATRTKRVEDELVKNLIVKGRPKDEAGQKARLALGSMELAIKDDGKSEYLLFLGKREIVAIAEVINTRWDSIAFPATVVTTDSKKPGKAKKQAAQNADPELQKALDAVFNGGKALDVALFGRMLADMPEKNQNAACQVAHAISTHAVEREFDFYTAVDDLKPEDTAGADMMGTVEFNSACFYRYAVVDWEKLLENLQGDSELAAKGLKAFIDGFIVGEPTGKQNTFAAHNPPEFISISVRHNTAPRNLANAFEAAVRVPKGESIMLSSVSRLNAKATALEKLYGSTGNARHAYAQDVLGEGFKAEGLGEPLGSLAELTAWVEIELKKQEK